MINIRDDNDFINEYLRDESRLTGKADSISFPQSEAEIQEAVNKFSQSSTPVTIQGSRTGITGGAVPMQGHILNLSRMNNILGLRHVQQNNIFYLTVQPGLKLQDLVQTIDTKQFDTADWSEQSLAALKVFLRQGSYFFPPDPTETTASLGGMAACNASGARSFYYGPTRNYIQAMNIILTDGGKLCVRRGEQRSNDGRFTLSVQAVGAEKKYSISGRIPCYARPPVKNAAGYFSGRNIDLIDLFIGSEGTLGVISQIELKLIPAPAHIWGGIFFFAQEKAAVEFANILRQDNFLETPQTAHTRLAAIEFFDSRALDLVSTLADAEYPHPPETAKAALYLEAHSDNEERIGEYFMHVAQQLEEKGEDPDLNWLAYDKKQMKKLTDFRHTVPEAVNLLLDTYKKMHPHITKLGTDMAVPDEKLLEVYRLYRSLLEPSGLDFTMFGHIGDNHIHANIIPKNAAEYARGKLLYTEIAHAVLAMDGTISAEHGIGKLKTELLKAMYGESGIKEMKKLKEYFDPKNMFNQGNLW
ncbi:MAG: FAD-binding oxidoreductase [Spirochaetales bacterium]|nr:FAD-binding oxidoreductase [Spirochaetales bacterium]